MGIARIIRQNERSWGSLFMGKLGRLLPPEQRFSCIQEPLNIVWISADATLDRIAVICWEDMEFYALGAASSVRQFKRDETEDAIIGECELIVVLIAVLSWCCRHSHNRIMIICADNMNVFYWLSKWRSESCTANTILKALIDFLVEAGVEIIPRYVRSDRNAAADFLTRCTGKNVTEWDEKNGMLRIWLPKDWMGLVERWKPEINFTMILRVRIPEVIEEFGHKLT